MSKLRNTVQLIGKLGANPDVKTFDGGSKVAKFSIAVNEYFKNNKGESTEKTSWHTIVTWGKLADFVENYLQKGKEVVCQGRLSTRNYEAKDGTKRTVTEIIANEIHLS